MKKLSLLLLLHLVAFTLFAQRHEPPNLIKDKQDYQGYTIRLLPTKGSGYGYVILRGNQLVAYQADNPFTMSPMGLNTKEDAYKVAQWQINHLDQQEQSSNVGLQNKIQQGSLAIERKGMPSSAMKSTKQRTLPHRPSINQHLSKDVAQQLKINLQ